MGAPMANGDVPADVHAHIRLKSPARGWLKERDLKRLKLVSILASIGSLTLR
jgi:hypothetical protein